jgi:hypothetical protein
VSLLENLTLLVPDSGNREHLSATGNGQTESHKKHTGEIIISHFALQMFDTAALGTTG